MYHWEILQIFDCKMYLTWTNILLFFPIQIWKLLDKKLKKDSIHKGMEKNFYTFFSRLEFTFYSFSLCIFFKLFHFSLVHNKIWNWSYWTCFGFATDFRKCFIQNLENWYAKTFKKPCLQKMRFSFFLLFQNSF